MTADEVTLVWRYVYDAHAAIKGARAEFRKLGRKELPQYPDTLERVVELVKRLATGTRRPSPIDGESRV